MLAYSPGLRVIDPCCGAGAFLIKAFDLLRQMRMIDEGLSAAEAGNAVLRENLFGLELDPLCMKSCEFGLSMAAWKSGGYRVLPPMNLACSGYRIQYSQEEWRTLVAGDVPLEAAVGQLWELFQDAPELGSLINPRRQVKQPLLFHSLILMTRQTLQYAVQKAVISEKEKPIAEEFCEVALVCDMLMSQYHLVATNPPFLARGKQGPVLRDYCARYYPDAKADLAAAFTERCLELGYGSLAAHPRATHP